MRRLTPARVAKFRREIYRHYALHRRRLPWRRARDPYRILVSEIMLQQTQVGRVREKYPAFIKAFPDFYSLARAPLRKILRAWQGMGYNRRALSLKRIAQRVVSERGGKLPADLELLQSLPGIGYNTASSIAAFAFNAPVVFIETNVRTVFIHFFFTHRSSVADAQVLPLVRQTLDRRNPREWYNALMDYGTMLKEKHGNPGRRSVHYRPQSRFEGSRRQVRGMIIRAFIRHGTLTGEALAARLGVDAEMLRLALRELLRDGLVRETRGRYAIC